MEAHDALFYVFSLSDALVADFLRAINTTGVVQTITIERGYQRSNDREVFGQLDGLRNVIPKSQRPQVAFVQADNLEPAWAIGGSYLAWVKIQQHVDKWSTLSTDQQAAIIGRRLDGSRLDLAAGTDPATEGPFASASPPPALCSHIRKAGPRGPNQDPVRILRRGTPFIECSGGALIEGLQFVSYQASIDDFLTIFQRWMLNVDFPTAGAQLDSLFDPNNGLVTPLKGSLYFAVPHDDRFIGAGLFDPTGVSDLVIRLTMFDSNGQPDLSASLEGATFQIVDATGFSTTVTTDAAGRALAQGVPTGVALTVTETAAPANAQVSPGPSPQTITLDGCGPKELTFGNTHPSGTPGY